MKFPNPFRFVLAMARTAWARLRGYEMLVNEAEEFARWNICRRCPHRIVGPELIGDQCGKCTCLLDAKVLLAMEECPIKKWKRVWRRSRETRTVQ
jgi:hypothetical protein